MVPRLVTGLMLAVASCIALVAAAAAQTVKIGFINTYSGPFA